MAKHVGTVRALWRYPVKSMLGEELPAVDVTERGMDGDRTLALLDSETGKVASAKNPRLWRRLLTLSAVTTDDGIRVVAPDNTRVDHDGLSEIVGRPVTLTAEPPPGASLDRAQPDQVLHAGADAEVDVHAIALPPGTFFDHSPLHLLTTGTLDRIGELSPRGTVELQRYRPNIVIHTDERGFVENAWIGRELTVGPELRLRITVPTPRCAVPTLAHGPLPRDPHALRVPAQHNRREPLTGMGLHPCAGVHAQVITPGRIGWGDPVLLD
ncbi:MOSC N-terminal beta barrel domain-containing protein [Streptomyces sp. NPDC006184]|uniref:MOSC domain-containing protein n=1 Tax=unclassified Streptomyces TaxID=2593676 RepID=UPI0033AFB179